MARKLRHLLLDIRAGLRIHVFEASHLFDLQRIRSAGLEANHLKAQHPHVQHNHQQPDRANIPNGQQSTTDGVR